MEGKLKILTKILSVLSLSPGQKDRPPGLTNFFLLRLFLLLCFIFGSPGLVTSKGSGVSVRGQP